MEANTINDVQDAIKRSGFPLEHYVGVVLKRHGWQIITNRNYIDDIKGIEREIDILAYKLYQDKEENIDYITTLIISCKKSDKYKWCFLTRDIDGTDCNINWTPFHYCTSDDRLKCMTEKHLDTIVGRYKTHRAIKHLYSFDDMVFAYQQLSKPNNDNERKQKGNLALAKNEDIYNSISTTIKAISNEKEGRLRAYDYSTKQRYYTFHAISVFEGEMFKAHFDSKEEVDVKEIMHTKYLNRHIVGNVDDFYIVHFINREIFDFRLRLFDYLHSENANTLPKLLPLFYKELYNDSKMLKIVWSDAEKAIKAHIRYSLNEVGYTNIDTSMISLYPILRNDELNIEVWGLYPSTQEALDNLNSNEWLKETTKKYLSQQLRYNGEFKFVEESLPF